MHSAATMSTILREFLDHPRGGYQVRLRSRAHRRRRATEAPPPRLRGHRQPRLRLRPGRAPRRS